MIKLPKFRKSDIVWQDLGEELLIYDLKINKAYCLNETSKLVYQACDGITDLAELKTQNNFTDDLVLIALDELKKNNLLEKSEELLTQLNGFSRREAAKRLGLATLLTIPVIIGFTAPTAAQNSSGRCVGNGTTLNGDIIPSGGPGTTFCALTQADCNAAAMGSTADACCSGTATLVIGDPNCGGSDPPNSCRCILS